MLQAHRIRAYIGRALAICCTLCLGLSASISAAAAPATYYLFVFSAPMPGHEAEYNQEYADAHAPDVVSVPGFVTAQRYVYADQQLREVPQKKPKYVVVYKIVTDNLAAVYAEVDRRLQTGETRSLKWADTQSFMSATYRVTQPMRKGVGGQPNDAAHGTNMTYHQFVFSDAVPGKDAEYNTWYNEHHLPEMISRPGFTGAQRMELADVQLGTPPATWPKYLADFVIETPDLSAVLREFSKRAATFTNSSAASGDLTLGYTYQAIGPQLDGNAIRASRKLKSKQSRDD